MSGLNLLDCTLRDGGYVNDWKWGFQQARDIIRALVKANIDVVEVGFLRNVDRYDPDITVCNRIEELNSLLPEQNGNTIFSAMAMRSNYDIQKLTPYSGKGIEMIRITAHDYDLREGMDFARQVKDKGYKLSINPINIMGYSDEDILWIIQQVNTIQPYQFSIVDTFGSMKRRDLDRIVSIVDHNLDRNIRVALHLHENMSLSCSLAQTFVDKHLNRPIAVDGSLFGMGRIPGNLPIELIADYYNSSYDIDYLLDAIQEYISPIKGVSEWGYTPAYFLSARFNLHRNYAEHYLKKGDLTIRDIDCILSRIERSKATAFDMEYADRLYEEYLNRQIDDRQTKSELTKVLKGKKLLLIAPGNSLKTQKAEIDAYIRTEKPTIISVNFVPPEYQVDYVFFGNNKRFTMLEKPVCKVIITSNVIGGGADYIINYNSVAGTFKNGCNSLIMLLQLLSSTGVKQVVIAGADGYVRHGDNYCTKEIRNYVEHDAAFNAAVADAISNIRMAVHFLTPSRYERQQREGRRQVR